MSMVAETGSKKESAEPNQPVQPAQPTRKRSHPPGGEQGNASKKKKPAEDDEPPESPDEDDEPLERTCSGVTKRGGNCKNKKSGAGAPFLCHSHVADTPSIARLTQATADWKAANRSSSPETGVVAEIPEFPEMFDPCDYFRQQLSTLKERTDVAEWISVADASQEDESDAERMARILFYSIHSVSEAITRAQGPDQGFSLIDYNSLTERTAIQVVRPHRPLLLPYEHNGHRVLLVIQTESKRNIMNGSNGALFEGVPVESDDVVLVHVLDSGLWMLQKDDRQQIFEYARNLVTNSNWNHHTYPILSAAEYGESAEQIEPEDTSNPVYTVLNAWSILFGRERNIAFQPHDNFIEDATDLMRIARGGFADWRLIWSFLRCQKFVKGAGVPMRNRTFARTIAENVQDQQFPGVRRDPETMTATTPSCSNYTYFGEGLWLHTLDIPTDTWPWEQSGRAQWAVSLRREGLSVSRLSSDMFTGIYNARKADPTKAWTKDLEAMKAELAQQGHHLDDAPVQEVVQYFAEHHRVRQQVQFDKINKDLRSYWHKRLAAYTKLGIESRPFFSLPNTPSEKDLGERYISLAISSVTDAIMLSQNDLGMGGFARSDPGLTARAAGDMGRSLSPMATAVRPRRVWYVPYRWHSNDKQDFHTVLVVVQEEQVDDHEHEFRIYVLDTLPHLFRDRYGELVREIKTFARMAGWTSHRNHARRVDFAAGPGEGHQYGKAIYHSQDRNSSILVILNAWGCALGLTVAQEDLPEALPENFPTTAWALVVLSLLGVVDWTTITAFLMHHRFVRERQIEAVPVDRRFAHTSLMTRAVFEQRRQLLAREDDFVSELRPDDQRHPYDFRNNVNFSQYGDDDPARDPARDPSLTGGLPGGGLPGGGLPGGGLPRDHCKDYVERLRALRDDKAAKAWFKELQRNPMNTSMLKKYLHAREVEEAIISVTAAITKLQGPDGGFSSLEAVEHEPLLDIPTMATVSRFGRPMLLPIIVHNHMVLLVLQLDQGVPSISIIDSRTFHMLRDHRDEVFIRARRIISETDWVERLQSSGNSVQLPDHANWVASAQQNGEWECGYYTVISAWALAMGLELNLDFKPRHPDYFFGHVQQIMWFARGGLLDWRFIDSFLRCHGVVTPVRTVPTDRQFSSTQKDRSDEEYTAEHNTLRKQDGGYWDNETSHGRARIRTSSQVTIPAGGLPHTEIFNSDNWSERTRHQRIPELQKQGRFDPKSTEQQLIAAFERINRTTAIDAAIEDFSAIPPSTDYVKNVDRFLNYLGSSVGGFGEEELGKNACEYYKRRIRYLNKFHEKYPPSPKLRITPGQGLLDEEVMNAIASVITRIDEEVSTLVNITSGFALTTSMGISGLPDIPLSRPRRCWLLPFVLAGENVQDVYRIRSKRVSQKDLGKKPGPEIAHTILAVVQEEDVLSDTENEGSGNAKSATEFKVYFLDSAAHFTANAKDFLYEKIKAIVRGLRWDTYQNTTEPTVRFSETCWEVTVARQKGQWVCGIHTIVNAWILGMGLTPSPTWHAHEKIYKEAIELIQYAAAALLDWKTLAAWLVCRGLIVETDPTQVPNDRRFTRSGFNLDDESIMIHITQVNSVQDNLDLVGGSEIDRSTNVNFRGMTTTPISAMSQADKRRWLPGHQLMRSYEDSELEDLPEFDGNDEGLNPLAFLHSPKGLVEDSAGDVSHGEGTDRLAFLEFL